jgi:hypothetical protein
MAIIDERDQLIKQIECMHKCRHDFLYTLQLFSAVRADAGSRKASVSSLSLVCQIPRSDSYRRDELTKAV